ARDRPTPHSFPTRRSSDLHQLHLGLGGIGKDVGQTIAGPASKGGAVGYFISGDSHHCTGAEVAFVVRCAAADHRQAIQRIVSRPDRKSTRLNSSHVTISYA